MRARRIIFDEWVIGVLLYLCVLYYSTILYSHGVGGISKAFLSFLRMRYSMFEGKRERGWAGAELGRGSYGIMGVRGG